MRKIIIITLISLSLSFNLRFLQNKEEIYKVNEEVKNASEKINGFQKVDNLFYVADKISSTWVNLANAFKTKHLKQIKKMTNGKGFEYFHGSSEIFLSFGLRQSHYDKYWLRKAMHLKIPKDMNQTFLEIVDNSKFIDKQAWTLITLAFNPEGSEKNEVKGICILINPPFEGKYDVMIVDVKNKFKLASNLFIMDSKTSVLGDIFEKEEEKIFKRPKSLTQDELTAILEMYTMVSLKILCEVFGINITPPNF